MTKRCQRDGCEKEICDSGQELSQTCESQNPREFPRKQKGFLEEAPGRKSAMRAMGFVALLAAIGFGVLELTEGDPTRMGGFIIFSFLLAAFAPKALQKFAEQGIPKR